jgi:hypothetical protein
VALATLGIAVAYGTATLLGRLRQAIYFRLKKDDNLFIIASK